MTPELGRRVPLWFWQDPSERPKTFSESVTSIERKAESVRKQFEDVWREYERARAIPSSRRWKPAGRFVPAREWPPSCPAPEWPPGGRPKPGMRGVDLGSPVPEIAETVVYGGLVVLAGVAIWMLS